MPEVGLANEIERTALETVISLRGYGFTEDRKMYTEGVKGLDKLAGLIKATKEHAAKYPPPGQAQGGRGPGGRAASRMAQAHRADRGPCSTSWPGSARAWIRTLRNS